MVTSRSEAGRGVTVLDPLLAPSGVADLAELWHRFPVYVPSNHQRRQQGPQTDRRESARATSPVAGQIRPVLAPELGARHDAGRNFVRSGGRLGRTGESPALLEARTNYFRAVYARGRQAFAPGIEAFFGHEVLREAARRLFGHRICVPALVYANLMLPGQELGVHTDVPEFRGVSRRRLPAWLLVVMRHSGLFEDRRVPIATVVAYVGDASGGDFAYYPSGVSAPAAIFRPRPNSAVVFDGDSVFHGVDRVDGDDRALASLRASAELRHVGRGSWELNDNGRPIASYETSDLRFSVSWKAFCFPDASAQAAFAAGQDPLSVDGIVERLVTELISRDRLCGPDHGLGEKELANLLIDEFVRFPPSPA